MVNGSAIFICGVWPATLIFREYGCDISLSVVKERENFSVVIGSAILFCGQRKCGTYQCRNDVRHLPEVIAYGILLVRKEGPICVG